MSMSRGQIISALMILGLPLAVAVQEHLGVAVIGRKDVAAGLELSSKLAVVVDAAVEDDGQETLRFIAAAGRDHG